MEAPLLENKEDIEVQRERGAMEEDVELWLSDKKEDTCTGIAGRALVMKEDIFISIEGRENMAIEGREKMAVGNKK